MFLNRCKEEREEKFGRLLVPRSVIKATISYEVAQGSAAVNVENREAFLFYAVSCVKHSSMSHTVPGCPAVHL